jgi:hypothetical protein
MSRETLVCSWIECKLDPPAPLAQWVLEYQQLLLVLDPNPLQVRRMNMIFDYLMEVTI